MLVLSILDLLESGGGITALQRWFVAPRLLVPHVALVAGSVTGAWLNRCSLAHLAVSSVPAYFLMLHTLPYPSSRYVLPAMALVCTLAASAVTTMIDTRSHEGTE